MKMCYSHYEHIVIIIINGLSVFAILMVLTINNSVSQMTNSVSNPRNLI